MTPEIDERPSKSARMVLLLIAVGLLGIFSIAVGLEPDPRGFGTHQQLGLPPCQFRSWTGLPCPHCGMTTSFCHVVRGNLKAAWDANPLGLILSVALALTALWSLATASSGRWIGTAEPSRWFIYAAIVYLTLAVVAWLLRIVF